MAGRKPKSALPSGRQAAVGHSDFAALLAEVKGRSQAAQTRAVLAVNAELVRLYWDIGQMIEGRQRREGWGAAVIPRLARELKNELPELKGVSERTIDRMIAFYRAYPDPAGFSPPAVAKLPPGEEVPQVVAKSSTQIVQGAPAQTPDARLWSVPWAHHVVLMEKVKDLAVRRWHRSRRSSMAGAKIMSALINRQLPLIEMSAAHKITTHGYRVIGRGYSSPVPGAAILKELGYGG